MTGGSWRVIGGEGTLSPDDNRSIEDEEMQGECANESLCPKPLEVSGEGSRAFGRRKMLGVSRGEKIGRCEIIVRSPPT